MTQEYGTNVQWADETATGNPTATHYPQPRSHAARLKAALSKPASSVTGVADIGAAEPTLTVGQKISDGESNGNQWEGGTTVLLLVLDDGPEQGAATAMFPASESRGGCTLGPCTLGDGAAVMGAINERAGLARRKMWSTIAPQSTESPLFLHLTDSSPQGLRCVMITLFTPFCLYESCA